MKRLAIALLISLPLFTACGKQILTIDRFPSTEVEFVNDTEYDCTISWTDFEVKSIEEQSLTIPAGGSYSQVFPPTSQNGLSIDGHSNIIYAQSATFVFKMEDTAIYRTYTVIREDIGRTTVTGAEWSSLPHFKEETIDIPNRYSCVIHIQLSDVLYLAH